MVPKSVVFVTLTGLLSLWTASGAAAGDVTPVPAQPPGGERLTLDQFYTGADAPLGEFPGKLVCLRTDKSFASANAEECTTSRIYALAIESPPATIPLLAANEKAQQQMANLVNRAVVVRGKHYSSIGIIAVGDIETAETVKGVGH